MTLFELILAVVVIVAATVAAILNHLSPELAGILGVALGYVAKGALNTTDLSRAVASPLSRPKPPPFEGAPSE